MSGEIAFVFLCLLLNPSVDLWPPHATYLVSSLEIELGAVVTPKGKQPKKLNPGFLYPHPRSEAAGLRVRGQLGMAGLPGQGPRASPVHQMAAVHFARAAITKYHGPGG